MNIKHDPLFNVAAVAAHYSHIDGVPVKYICTSEVSRSNSPMDIFYRDTPHPKFGNHYFGVFYDSCRDSMMVTSAQGIEGADFAMIEIDGEWHYSSYRHDFKQLTDSNGITKFIDGGRAYIRGHGYEFYKVENGEIVKEQL
jgi:hypothetical protein